MEGEGEPSATKGVTEGVTEDAMDDVIAGEDSANLDEAEVVAANEHANVVAGEAAENVGGRVVVNGHTELGVVASVNEGEASREGEEEVRSEDARVDENAVGVAGAYGMEAACENGKVAETVGEVIAHAYGDAREDVGAGDVIESTYVAEHCVEIHGAPSGGRAEDMRCGTEVGVARPKTQYLMKQKHHLGSR